MHDLGAGGPSVHDLAVGPSVRTQRRLEALPLGAEARKLDPLGAGTEENNPYTALMHILIAVFGYKNTF